MIKKLTTENSIVYLEDSEHLDPEGNPLVLLVPLEEYKTSEVYSNVLEEEST